MIQLKNSKAKGPAMSLSSVATPIWNEIARTQTLRTAWARKAFALDDAAMTALENKEFARLKQAEGQAVASAYLDMKPLLLENLAISRYCESRPDLRNALPEVPTVTEAVLLASADHPLSPQQQKRLQVLLQESNSAPQP